MWATCQLKWLHRLLANHTHKQQNKQQTIAVHFAMPTTPNPPQVANKHIRRQRKRNPVPIKCLQECSKSMSK
jgi:hypothetical protein